MPEREPVLPPLRPPPPRPAPAPLTAADTAPKLWRRQRNRGAAILPTLQIMTQSSKRRSLARARRRLRARPAGAALPDHTASGRRARQARDAFCRPKMRQHRSRPDRAPAQLDRLQAPTCRKTICRRARGAHQARRRCRRDKPAEKPGPPRAPPRCCGHAAPHRRRVPPAPRSPLSALQSMTAHSPADRQAERPGRNAAKGVEGGGEVAGGGMRRTRGRRAPGQNMRCCIC